MTGEASESAVGEAIAAYSANPRTAAFREFLEQHAAEYPLQPCRVVDEIDEDGPLLRLEVWDFPPTNNGERWDARQAGEPHPPRPWQWLPMAEYRQDQLTDEMISEAISEREAQADQAREAKESGLWLLPDPAPPGYEDDYDIDDWFYDLRHGFL